MYLHWNEYPFEAQSSTFENQGLITINFELLIQIVLLTVSFSFWEQACTGEPPFVDPVPEMSYNLLHTNTDLVQT